MILHKYSVHLRVYRKQCPTENSEKLKEQHKRFPKQNYESLKDYRKQNRKNFDKKEATSENYLQNDFKSKSRHKKVFKRQNTDKNNKVLS